MRHPFFTSIGLTFLSAALIFPTKVEAVSLVERLSGRILLQVQSHGEAWYVDPVSKTRLYLGTPKDAFQILRLKGLGIRHAELERYRTTQFPLRLSGRILIDVEDRGQAYYILPQAVRAVRLGNAEETYQVLRQQGLGITTSNLEQIRFAPSILPPALPLITPPTSSLPATTVTPEALEQRMQGLINQHRQSIGLQSLVWNDAVASVARTHSQNMSAERVAFGHDGFDMRFQELRQRISISQIAENVAMNTYYDPVTTAFEGWLQSEGHRHAIENGVYTQTGIGIAKRMDGAYYFTQIFVK